MAGCMIRFIRWMFPVLFLTAALNAFLAHAEDWPEFRGPTGQGHSTETGLPLEWSETRNIGWKTPVPGLGWSSPSISGGLVWLTTALEKQDPVSLRVLAFDARTGREILNIELFNVQSDPLLNPKNSYATPTPVIEGDRVYVHFGADGTAAVTTAGDVIWKTRLSYNAMHGQGGSPVLYGDLLIISCDGDDDGYVVALDKRTGEVRWKTPRRKPSTQAYSTPLVIRVGGQDQVVSTGGYGAAAYDPVSGREIWYVRYPDGYSNVPRPVYGHGLVYLATGLQHPSLLAIRPDGAGDVTATHIVWRLDRAVPVTSSPLLLGDEIYIVSDIGIATCLDAKTGKIHWQQRLGDNHSASPVFADGRIYFLNEQGVMNVLAPGKKFRRLAMNSLDGLTLASPAVSGGSIYLRSANQLYRISTP
jgi:outer membrane protein assembly factor BamB